jgi:hypothetical protein
MVARGTFVEVLARRSFVAVKASISRACAVRRLLGERPAQKDCRFIESAMPADGIPRCGFASNGDVGTSRLEGQL